MSARLDPVAGTERRTIPVPYGHHLYVVSDLSLSPTTDVTSRPIKELLSLLGEIDDAAVVVVAGNLFHPDSTSDLAKFIEATLIALPTLRSVFEAFCAKPGHRLFVLPGGDDEELRDNERAQALLKELGVIVASDLMLQIATASGVRDLAVVAGTYGLDVAPVDPSDRADADRLEDPHALERFVSSRVLYRRLGAWVWLPILAIALLDVWGFVMAIAGHFTHHHFSLHVIHSTGFWTNLSVELVAIAVVETFIAALAGLIVRRRFERRNRGAKSDELSVPLTFAKVGDVDALEFA